MEQDAQQDAEAEVVLLTLGPRLNWHLEKEGWWVSETLVHDTLLVVWYEAALNVVECGFSVPLWRWCPYLNTAKGNVNGPACETIAAAKAACERHLATGKWE